VDRFPIERTSVVTDPDCDRPFLAAQLHAAWVRMADGSPNSGTSPRRVHVSIRHRARVRHSPFGRRRPVPYRVFGAAVMPLLRRTM
jgi:hypothetical protein